MEKITSLFGGHKKEGEETHGEVKAQTTVEHSSGQGQATRPEEGEKKGLFGIGGHKDGEKHEGKGGKEGKADLFGHMKKNKGSDSSSSSSSESEGEDNLEKQKRRKERKEKKKGGRSHSEK